MSAPAAELTDAAWVVVDSPLEPAQLADFCADLERLFRINPLLEFRDWRANGSARFEAAFRNLATGQDLDLELTVERTGGRCMTVHYDCGLKRSTRFEIEPAPCGSRLKITEDYSGIDPAEARARAREVDRSLTPWGVALHTYLQHEKRWGRYALWRWYMRRFWLPMKPVARRITYILMVITGVEIAVFALAIGIYLTQISP